MAKANLWSKIFAVIIGFILIFTGGVTFGITTIAGVILILFAFFGEKAIKVF